LAHVADDDLPEFLTRLIAARNFFTGANPFVLTQFYRSDPEISGLLAAVRLSRPWLWDFGPRVYAVCAISATRSCAAP
jgi:hypothetical protein